MKLRFPLETVDMGEEIIAVPVGKGSANVNGVVKLNKAGFEILDLLREETTEDIIVDELRKRYENDDDTLYEYVNSIVTNLRGAGLIEE